MMEMKKMISMTLMTSSKPFPAVAWTKASRGAAGKKAGKK